MKKHFLLLSFISLFFSLSAQKRNITLEEIWKDYKFSPHEIDELRSTTDGNHYTVLSDNGGIQAILMYDYASGKITDTLLSSKELAKAGNEFSIDSYFLSPGEKNILLSSGTEKIYRHSSIARCFIWNREKKTLTKLGDHIEKKLYTTFSHWR